MGKPKKDGELKMKMTTADVVEVLADAGFTDGLDASFEISLFEYGILYNPNSEYVIYTTPKSEASEGSTDPSDYAFDYTRVSVGELREVLDDLDEGFFSFTGQSRDLMNQMIDQAAVATVIHDVNSWNGYFKDSCTWSCDWNDVFMYVASNDESNEED
jgi:hypothetical protein